MKRLVSVLLVVVLVILGIFVLTGYNNEKSEARLLHFVHNRSDLRSDPRPVAEIRPVFEPGSHPSRLSADVAADSFPRRRDGADLPRGSAFLQNIYLSPGLRFLRQGAARDKKDTDSETEDGIRYVLSRRRAQTA